MIRYEPGLPPVAEMTCDLAVDPGHTCGWAQRVGPTISIGEAFSDEVAVIAENCGGWLGLEMPPRNAPRAFEPEVHWSFGVLRYVRPAHEVMSVARLRPARKWFTLERGSSVSPHAKDALAHLLYHLVLPAQEVV